MSSAANELLNQVVEIAACTAEEAAHLLAACSNNVEAAVSLFFEQGAVAGSGGVTGGNGASIETDASVAAALAAADNGMVDDDDVRAPIAPIREQLIGPEDDNFFASAPSSSTRRMQQRLAAQQRVKVCPLRDFAREGALMEEQLQSDNIVILSETSTRRRAANMVATAQATERNRPGISSRLGDLFRPPTDLLYSGTFQAARSYATKRKLWLLVNVQSDNFDSQVLNRDVWSSKEVRRLVRRQFILWQVDCDSSEGRRFVAFYKCAKLPYVCVIDPRTGEEVWHSAEPKQANILPDLQTFLREHKDFSIELSEDAPSTSKRHIVHIDLEDDEDDNGAGGSGSGSSSSVTTKKRVKLLELTEEEQLELAIKNSINENGGSKKSKKTNNVNIDEDEDDDDDGDDASDLGSVEEFGADDIKAACELTSYEQKLGLATNEITALKLRLLNASGTDECVQLHWPSDTLLQVLRLYIAQQQPHIPKEGYKIICAFPRKTLDIEHNSATLKELGLHPSANLHLTLDD